MSTFIGGSGADRGSDDHMTDSESDESVCESGSDEECEKQKKEQIRKQRVGKVEINNQGIKIKYGPSGKPLIHCKIYSSRKQAYEAAKRDSQEYAKSAKHEPLDHQAHGTRKWNQGKLSGKKRDDFINKNKKGQHYRHFHAVDKKGKKLENGVHYCYPSNNK